MNRFVDESAQLDGSKEQCEPRAKELIATHADLARWAAGNATIPHGSETVCRVHDLVEFLASSGGHGSKSDIYRLLSAADNVARAAMWSVVHMTYAKRVFLDGRPLGHDDFKESPEGHTGGSLNMVPAYVGYMLANALTGRTRSWIMGQGHCVAAIDSVNILLGNLNLPQASRYAWTDTGLSNLVSDFYSYKVDQTGRPLAPVGSHVNANTAGGVSEGGYLGFAEVQYVHMPLKGESLVAFLSDGAFEEQRGSDWSPRWWRQDDSGLVCPVMILNGRRIEQRSEMAQEGGSDWLRSHLVLSGFDPITIDGRDPAAFAWAILESERRLTARGGAASSGKTGYPVRLPYVIANTVKGYGFPGAGTNAAHNLPLPGNPSLDVSARDDFNRGARSLWVDPVCLKEAAAALANHGVQNRPQEKDHALACRMINDVRLPEPSVSFAAVGENHSPMELLDKYFLEVIKRNSHLRIRVGNPDEMQSNHMARTLQELKHRVNRPEDGAAEAVDGRVITALNEEAVVGAALANKGGLNLVISYEAFAVKMLGAVRQEVIFARGKKDHAYQQGWLAVPIIVTSHAWENGKNELSHQDTTFSEALLGEMSDTARVLFPADANTAVACMMNIYGQRGQIACIVVAKREVPSVFSAKSASLAVRDGAGHVSGDAVGAQVQLVAIGAYQLQQCLAAAQRLSKVEARALVTCLIEPGRFREPRDAMEAEFTVDEARLQSLFPVGVPKVVVCHTRPEPMAGILRRIDEGSRHTSFMGFKNRGGTLDTAGLLFANGITWAHIAEAACRKMGLDPAACLTNDERQAIANHGDPRLVMAFPA